MKSKNAQRQADFKARMIRNGLIQVNVWASKEVAKEINQIALESRIKVIEERK